MQNEDTLPALLEIMSDYRAKLSQTNPLGQSTQILA